MAASDDDETSTSLGIRFSFAMRKFASFGAVDGPGERDGKSWELCNWNEHDGDDDSAEIGGEHLRNPNSFLLSSSRRFL